MIRKIETIEVSEGIILFLEGLRSQNKAESTIKEYNRVLNRLDTFLSNNKVNSISNINHMIVNEFLEHCKDKYNLKYKTIYKYYAFLSNFFTEMYNLDYISTNPTNKLIIKSPKNKNSFFYIDYNEIEKIFRASKNQNNKLRSLTDSCFIRLLAETGLRRTDGLSLKWNQIKLHRKEINIFINKINKEIIVPISDPLYTSLLELKSYTRPNLFDPVFLSNKLVQLSSVTLNNYFKKHVEKSGVIENIINKITNSDMPVSQKEQAIESVKITPHTLRHSFITKCFLEGKEAEEISALIGSSDMDTILSYKSILKTDYRVIADVLDAI